MPFDYASISLNGMPMVSPMLDDVVRIEVDTNIHMPSMFEIHIVDEPALGIFKWIDSPLLAIGTLVKITAKSVGTANLPASVPIPGTLIDGEITALEPRFASDGSATLVVRGYDKMHRLHRGRKTKTYLMQNESMIVQQVASSAGLMVTAMPTTSGVREYVLQNNQTDMEFLRELADRNGYDLMINDLGVLTFKKAGVPLPGPVLTWQQNLTDFEPRASAAGQLNTTVVQAWDPKTKQGVTAPSPVVPKPAGGPALAVDLAAARARFGATAKEVVTDQPIGLMPEAIALAQAKASEINQDWLKADGTCLGHPQVKAGRTVTVAGVGLKFSGSYLVTSATHIYDENGYITVFHADGSEPKALTTLLSNNAQEPGRIYGVVNGVVTNNMDPLGQGRVKVKFPFLGNLPPVESNWCRVATPMAGSMRGFYNIPEVNDEVLVAFEQGDVNFPYIVGSLWNMLDRPPLPSATVVVGGKVTKRMWKTPAGHQILLDDTPGNERIAIIDKTMQNHIEIDSKTNSVSITVLGDCKVNATGGVNLTAQSKDVEINCVNFKVTANANIQMKATAQAQIEGTAGLTMKNAAAQIAMTGPTVNINNGALEVM